eukprot:m.92399 g.92399  ORF g.92399 m.92399 type:complete len:98 (+) comp14666_c0_seq1:35-328(+)
MDKGARSQLLIWHYWKRGWPSRREGGLLFCPSASVELLLSGRDPRRLNIRDCNAARARRTLSNWDAPLLLRDPGGCMCGDPPIGCREEDDVVCFACW